MFKPNAAFILAAGKGTRMMPLTKTLPKPMVELCGRTLIDHIIDDLVRNNILQVAVNLHHFGNKIEAHLKTRTDVKLQFSKEHVLLDTGGGLRKAARFMGDDPYVVINGDSFLQNGPDKTAITRMAEAWDSDIMDILMLLQPIHNMMHTTPVGDYTIDADGRAVRSPDKTGTHMFTSVRMIRPQIFRGTPEGPFSFLEMMDKAQHEGRLYAIEHDGVLEHISTPEDLAAVENALFEKA